MMLSELHRISAGCAQQRLCKPASSLPEGPQAWCCFPAAVQRQRRRVPAVRVQAQQVEQLVQPAASSSLPDPHVGVQPDPCSLIGNTPMVRDNPQNPNCCWPPDIHRSSVRLQVFLNEVTKGIPGRIAAKLESLEPCNRCVILGMLTWFRRQMPCLLSPLQLQCQGPHRILDDHQC
jgi:hypothetical protein